MMSYTMLCTSLWVSDGMLIRFMSPSTRIIGGTPADRCKSEALFLTAKASSCAISTGMQNSHEEFFKSCARGSECAETSSQTTARVHDRKARERQAFAAEYSGALSR